MVDPAVTISRTTTTTTRNKVSNLKDHNVHEANNDEEEHLDSRTVNQLFLTASKVAVVTYVILLLFVFSFTDPNEWEYLTGQERGAACFGFMMFIASFGSLVIPFVMRRRRGISAMSGVVWSAVTILALATISSGLMAFAPTVVTTDPYTRSRVYFVRWCHWIPLSGVLTFYSEVVYVRKNEYGLSVSVVTGLAISLSCCCALVFPFCPNAFAWGLLMTVSMALYLVLVPRVLLKRRMYLSMKKGYTVAQLERYHRCRFAYHLLLSSFLCWTCLVIIYFAVMACNYLAPEGHWLRNPAIAMMGDTFHDVLSKSFFNRAIVEVHIAVFDAEGRSYRQLQELRALMSVLWESSSDVIILSVRQTNKVFTTLLSPKFETVVVGGAGDERGVVGNEQAKGNSTSLLVETKREVAGYGSESGANVTETSKAFRLDSSSGGPYPAGEINEEKRIAVENRIVVQQADAMISSLWNPKDGNLTSEAHIVHDMTTANGEIRKYEMTVTRRSDDTVIAVARDVTERHLRYEAECKAHLEAISRQKDAQAINKFTRHEVKNGLLAGIEMCDFLQNALSEIEKKLSEGDGPGGSAGSSRPDVDCLQSLRQDVVQKLDALEVPFPASTKKQGTAAGTTKTAMTMYVNEIGSTLQGVLDTVLAEAMARDVVHGVYVSQPERVEVKEWLSNNAGSGRTTSANRVLDVQLVPANMPPLLVDPQVLRYIHRNAVSNALKYGKKGGKVRTQARFSAVKGELEIDIINEPGENHVQLLAMGAKASEEVFSRATRLSFHKDESENECREDGNHSGDGAWIMQRCAAAMGGSCDIRFEPDQTIFSFRCPVEPCAVPWVINEQFEVPDGTWGVVLDDSAIQRRLMTRILLHAGVKAERIVVLGKNSKQAENFGSALKKILEEDRLNKILALVDENLDYMEKEGIRLSGSLGAEKAMKALSPSEASRVFALIRSASDSKEDVELFKSRAHGFLPKTSMDRAQAQEMLSELWTERFQTSTGAASSSEHEVVEEGDLLDFVAEEGIADEAVTREELMQSLRRVEGVLESETNATWPRLWGALHALMGDLRVIENVEEAKTAADMINHMRGENKPKGFAEKWDHIHETVSRLAERL